MGALPPTQPKTSPCSADHRSLTATRTRCNAAELREHFLDEGEGLPVGASARRHDIRGYVVAKVDAPVCFCMRERTHAHAWECV